MNSPNEEDHGAKHAPPRHVAIIMDGNGRWAKQRGLDRRFGHRAGVKALKPVVKEAAALGIEVLTVYAFSTENWKRPALEVQALMRLLVEYLRRETIELKQEGVRIQTVGNLEGLPVRAQRAVQESMALTENETRMVLNLALNYGGRDELIRAINRWLASHDCTNQAMTAEGLEACLDTHGLPDPDLLIRTSGEVRLSNFLLWQMAYAEIYITETYWPDFGPEQLRTAIREYQKRSRRFGRIG